MQLSSGNLGSQDSRNLLEDALRGRIFLVPAPRHSPHWPRSQHCLPPIGQGAEPGVLIGQDFGWAGLDCFPKFTPYSTKSQLVAQQTLDRCGIQKSKREFKSDLGGQMSSKIVLKCKQSTWPEENIDFEEKLDAPLPIIYIPTMLALN